MCSWLHQSGVEFPPWCTEKRKRRSVVFQIPLTLLLLLSSGRFSRVNVSSFALRTISRDFKWLGLFFIIIASFMREQATWFHDTRLKEEYLINLICKIPTVNIILNGEKLNAFFLRLGTKQRYRLSLLLFNLTKEVLSSVIRHEKIKAIQIQNGEKIFYLYSTVV